MTPAAVTAWFKGQWRRKPETILSEAQSAPHRGRKTSRLGGDNCPFIGHDCVNGKQKGRREGGAFRARAITRTSFPPPTEQAFPFLGEGVESLLGESWTSLRGVYCEFSAGFGFFSDADSFLLLLVSGKQARSLHHHQSCRRLLHLETMTGAFYIHARRTPPKTSSGLVPP